MQGIADQLRWGVPGEDDSDDDDHDNHDVLCQFIFAERRGDDYSCHHCVHIYVRTVNIIEKKESGCIQLPPGQRSWDNICNRRGQYSDEQSWKTGNLAENCKSMKNCSDIPNPSGTSFLDLFCS